MIPRRPAEGTQLEKGATVTLVVSSGRAQVRCPTSSARASTRRARRSRTPGFEVDATEQETTTKDPGTVLAQDPAAGRGSTRARR